MSDMPTLFDVEQIPTPTFRRCPCCQGTGMVVDLDQPIPSAPARPTDPDTAHHAARRWADVDVRRFKAGTRRAQLLAVIADHGPMTAQAATLAVLANMTANVPKYEGVRRRVEELKKAGYIADSGVRHVNPGATVSSIAWEVTGRGLEALDYLDKIGRSMP